MTILHIIYILLSVLVLMGVVTLVLLVASIRREARAIAKHMDRTLHTTGIIMGSISRMEEMTRAVADPFMDGYRQRRLEWITALIKGLWQTYAKKNRP